MTSTQPACEICANATGNKLHLAREMMFGTREPFQYLECAECGCVQLVDVPKDLSKYYGDNYYSLSTEPTWKSWLRKQRAGASLGQFKPLGMLVNMLKGEPEYVQWLREAGVTATSKILDVGCGSGQLLRELAGANFKSLTGVDPHAKSWSDPDGRLRILGIDPLTLTEKFDFIMLHHSFEHVTNPQRLLQHLSTLLSPSGTMLIRIPLASSYAWKTYGVNWVQLDPPRHLFLHTVDSLKRMLTKADLHLDKVVHDSGPMQFWGSELYKRDIPLKDARSPWVNAQHQTFSAAQMQMFTDQSVVVNTAEQGDQAAFYVRRVSPKHSS